MDLKYVSYFLQFHDKTEFLLIYKFLDWNKMKNFFFFNTKGQKFKIDAKIIKSLFNSLLYFQVMNEWIASINKKLESFSPFLQMDALEIKSI